MHLAQLLQIIHSPFQEYLLQYSQLQQTQLMNVIDSFSGVSNSYNIDNVECLVSLSSSVNHGDVAT